jgi:hypothetical protein
LPSCRRAWVSVIFWQASLLAIGSDSHLAGTSLSYRSLARYGLWRRRGNVNFGLLVSRCGAASACVPSWARPQHRLGSGRRARAIEPAECCRDHVVVVTGQGSASKFVDFVGRDSGSSCSPATPRHDGWYGAILANKPDFNIRVLGGHFLSFFLTVP